MISSSSVFSNFFFQNASSPNGYCAVSLHRPHVPSPHPHPLDRHACGASVEHRLALARGVRQSHRVHTVLRHQRQNRDPPSPLHVRGRYPLAVRVRRGAATLRCGRECRRGCGDRRGRLHRSQRPQRVLLRRARNLRGRKDKETADATVQLERLSLCLECPPRAQVHAHARDMHRPRRHRGRDPGDPRGGRRERAARHRYRRLCR